MVIVFWISIKCLAFIWQRRLHFLCSNWVFKCYGDECEASKGYTLSMEKFMGGQKIFDNHLSNFIHVDSLGFMSWVNIMLSHTCINICEKQSQIRWSMGHITRIFTNHFPVKFNIFYSHYILLYKLHIFNLVSWI
jgi:hypothetical protein